MPNRFDITPSDRDPWDPRDDFPPDRPAPTEYENVMGAMQCSDCGCEWSDPEPYCPACGSGNISYPSGGPS